MTNKPPVTPAQAADAIRDANALLVAYVHDDGEAFKAIIHSQEGDDGEAVNGSHLLMGMLISGALAVKIIADVLGFPLDVALGMVQAAGNGWAAAVGGEASAAVMAAADGQRGTQVPLSDLPPLVTTDEATPDGGAA